jgi:predicted DNA-binding transcriptional regulator YafY
VVGVMSRIKNTIRLLNILSLRSVVGISELADVLEVDPRTIRRMRDDLLDLGYDIESIHGPGGGLRLSGSSRLSLSDFTSNELTHIRSGLNYLSALDRGMFGHDFYQSIAKLNHYLDTNREYQVIDTALSVRLNVDGEVYQKIINMIESSIKYRKRIKITYEKNKREIREYVFEPYELIIVNGSWYMAGYDTANRQLSLKVSRIKNIEVLDVHFRWDEDFSRNQLINNFGFKVRPVRLKVKVTNFDYLSEYIWGRDQIIEWLDDTIYTLEADFPSKLLAQEFILKGGSHIEVISPDEMRTWIIGESTKILKQYQ